MKRALVINHVTFEDLGTLESALEQHNYAITYIKAGLDNLTDLDSSWLTS